MSYTECDLQALLMQWLLRDKHHVVAVTNSTVIYPWEADVASVTPSMYAHEFEVKISKADFVRDSKKMYKHMSLISPVYGQTTPNYFWYATPPEIEVEVKPPYGWVTFEKRGSGSYTMITKQEPKLLHKNKVGYDIIEKFARLISFRLADVYWEKFVVTK